MTTSHQVREHDQRILRLPDVMSKTGLSRSTVYGRIRAGDFPMPLPLGAGRAVGFIAQEVDSWIEAMAKRREHVQREPA